MTQNSMQGVADKVVLVTGAAGGIGAALATAFAHAGARLVLAGRSPAKLQAVAQDTGQPADRVACVAADVTDEASVAALFATAVERFGRVDVLVNSAGVTAKGAIDDMPLATWQKVIDTNLTGSWLCCREAFRVMKAQGGGRILNIGSLAARRPRNDGVPYAASKAGLEGMTQALALDGRAFGIAVSVLHPGNVATPFWKAGAGGSQREPAMPVEDVARIAVLMASLPADMNMLEAQVLPLGMPFLGRG